MKMHQNSTPRASSRQALAAAAMLTLAALPAYSATLYWDGNDTNANANGGAGTWTTGGTNWDDSPFGGANAPWANGDTAVFGGTAGTATIGTGGVTAGGVTFNTTGYTIAAGTNGLTFSSGTVDIQNIINGGSATITGSVGGTGANLSFSSHPLSNTTLTFSGISSSGWTGTTTINSNYTLATTTTSGNVNKVLNSTSGITLNGGTIQFNRATNAQLNAISDSAAITVNGGGTFGATSADSGGASANETVGAVTLNSGQMNFNWTNNPSSGGIIIMSDFIRSGSTSAVTFSQGTNGRFRNAAVSTNTAANEIIGPWATTGGANGIGAQTDYAIYSGGDGTVIARGIAASAQSTWSTAHAATSNYTLTNATGTAANGRLTATRNVNTVRNTSGVVNLTSVDTTANTITVTGSSFANGDVVQIGGTTPGGLANNTVYYVVGASGTTFQLAATSGGAAIDLTSAGSANIAGGITLSTGNNLGTFGILNGSTALLAIGGSGTGAVTLPTTSAGNLYVTAGAAGIAINAPITDNTGALTLVKGGTNGLWLTGTNTYTGGTVINSGTLSIGSVNNIGGAGASLTFGGSGTLAATGTLNFSSGTLTVNQGAVASQDGGFAVTFQTTTGAGTIVSRGGGSGAGVLNLGNASTFTGNIEVHSSNGTNPYPAVTFSSLNDAAGSFIAFGGSIGDSNQRQSITFNGTSPLTFDNRQVVLFPGSSNQTARYNTLANNSTGTSNTWVINTDLVNTSNRGANTQELIFAGSNTGDNAFNGAIGDSTTTAGGALWIGKTGAGKWIFGGNNTFTGRLIVNQGMLSVGTFNDIGTAGPLGMGSVQLGGSEVAIGTNINNQLGGNNSGTLEYTGGTVSSSRNFLIGDITAGNTGGGTLANNGSGAMTFTAANFNTAIAGITGTRTLTLGGSNGGEIQGIVQDNVLTTGKVDLAKSGAGTWTLSGANTYTGTTTVSDGILKLNNATALPGGIAVAGGTNNLTINGGGVVGLTANSGDFLRARGTGVTQVQWIGSGGFAAYGGDRTVNLNNDGASAQWNTGSFVPGSASLVLSAADSDATTIFANGINFAGSQRTVQVNNGSALVDARIEGALTGGTSSGLNKTGAGTLAITGTNTYTGLTTVATGTLLVNGNSSAATGNVSVASTATLGGTGSIGGAVTVDGTLSPGASIESLESGALTLANGSTFAYELNTASINGDLQKVNGALTIGTATLNLTDLSDSTALTAGTKLTLINYSGAWNSGIFTSFADDSTFVLGLNTWKIDYNDTTGGSNFAGDQTHSNYVTISVVPEPTTLGLLGLGAVGLMRRRRVA